MATPHFDMRDSQLILFISYFYLFFLRYRDKLLIYFLKGINDLTPWLKMSGSHPRTHHSRRSPCSSSCPPRRCTPYTWSIPGPRTPPTVQALPRALAGHPWVSNLLTLPLAELTQHLQIQSIIVEFLFHIITLPYDSLNTFPMLHAVLPQELQGPAPPCGN